MSSSATEPICELLSSGLLLMPEPRDSQQSCRNSLLSRNQMRATPKWKRIQQDLVCPLTTTIFDRILFAALIDRTIDGQATDLKARIADSNEGIVLFFAASVTLYSCSTLTNLSWMQIWTSIRNHVILTVARKSQDASRRIRKTAHPSFFVPIPRRLRECPRRNKGPCIAHYYNALYPGVLELTCIWLNPTSHLVNYPCRHVTFEGQLQSSTIN